MYLDDTTANLLDASFDVRERDEGWVLNFELELPIAPQAWNGLRLLLQRRLHQGLPRTTGLR